VVIKPKPEPITETVINKKPVEIKPEPIPVVEIPVTVVEPAPIPVVEIPVTVVEPAPIPVVEIPVTVVEPAPIPVATVVDNSTTTPTILDPNANIVNDTSTIFTNDIINRRDRI
jgi:hypothetical protein